MRNTRPSTKGELVEALLNTVWPYLVSQIRSKIDEWDEASRSKANIQTSEGGDKRLN